ncbi:MAG: hypothetical protein IT330_11335 [Anaerolineae bacterium]|nr:hypothetical protein [Anaerolineae bacterium]
MIIPNAERAVVDMRKLRDYCLNPTHDEGRHKARLFAAALGITREDVGELHDALLQAIKTHDAQLGRRDEYGQRYIVDFMCEWHGKRAMIRSSWIVEHGSGIPKLTSCYPL